MLCAAGFDAVPSTQNPDANFSIFEKRAEVSRILNSKYFSTSPKKKRFLEFVSEQTFLGNPEKLNEYLIGVEVYNRGSDFDQQKDPIVRVQAHEIRRLLKKYYEEDGRANRIRVELPPGHYVPIFSRIAPDPAEVAEPQKERVALEPLPASQPRSPRWLVALTVILAAACALLSVLLVKGRPQGGSLSHAEAAPAALPESLDWFWHPFLAPAEAPIIVIPNHPLLRAAHGGDSAQTWASGHEIPKTSLPEFRDTIHFRELRRFVFVPSLTDFTAVGETIGLVELCQMFDRLGRGCRVQQSRLVNFDEIKGNNVILLGGNQSWSGRVFVNTEGFQFQDGVILNRKPQATEQAMYKPEFDPVTNQLTRDYALILMLPNQQKENRILLVYGIYTQGSQAAIEFLMNVEKMAQLRKQLDALSPSPKTAPAYFQVLLTTTVENAVPGNASVVAVRGIPAN